MGTQKGIVQNVGWKSGVRISQSEVDAIRPEKFSQETINKVLELRKALKTEKEIAAEVGLTRSAVDHICMKNGVVLDASQHKELLVRLRDPFTEEEKANIHKWRTEEGLSLQAIGERLNKSATSIKNFCAKHGIKVDPKQAQLNAQFAKFGK